MHAASIRRLSIESRRGSGPYVLIPGATVEYPELLKPKKPKKGEEQTADHLTPDDRNTDPAKWALSEANGRWRVMVEWTKKNGPLLDGRLSAWWLNPKTGKLEIIKGGVSAKRCNTSGEQGAWMDGAQPGSMEHMNIALLGHLDRCYTRMNDQHGETTKHIAALNPLITANVNLALQLTNAQGANGMASVMQQQMQFDFLLKMQQMQLTGEGIKQAIDELAPIAKTFAANWRPTTAVIDPVSKIAKELLETITDDQGEKFKANELGDLFTDIVSMLKAIAACENKLEIAAEILKKVLPAMEKHQNEISALLTAQQRAGFVALIEASGVEGE